LHAAYIATLIALASLAATCWLIYFYQVLFRSGRIPLLWVKRGFTDLGVVLLIALGVFLICLILISLNFRR